MISILSVFPPYRGGIATFSDYLYFNLRKKTAVTAFNYSRLYPPFLFPGKSQFIQNVPDKDYAERILHSYNPIKWRRAAQQILQNDSKHLIISYWHPFFAPALLRIISFIKKKDPEILISILAHNVIPHESFPLGRWFSKKLLARADKVILLSEQSLQEARKLNIKTDIKTFFHPVYEQSFPRQSRAELRTAYGYSEQDRVFLFFGLIRPYKGLDLFIQALNQLDLKSLHIKPLIVGEFYNNKKKLLNQINPNYRKYYTIKDCFVSDEKAAELFTLSDALVMPYRSASQSGILANAINFYLPSIISNLPGLKEHVEHKETAWIFENGNIKQLKKAIEAFTEPKLLRHISTSLITLKEQLSWDTFIQAFLEEIVKEKQ